MNPARPLMRAVDRFQQRRPVLAFPVAMWKKFGDDQAGSLAALIAYYAFVSVFPLLLVLITVLDIVLRNHAALRERVLHDAANGFPGVGNLLTNSVHAKSGTGVALAVGLIFAFLGGRGIANAIMNALNTVWEVPLTDRPGFPGSLLRSVGILVVVGVGEIASFALAGLARIESCPQPHSNSRSIPSEGDALLGQTLPRVSDSNHIPLCFSAIPCCPVRVPMLTNRPGEAVENGGERIRHSPF